VQLNHNARLQLSIVALNYNHYTQKEQDLQLKSVYDVAAKSLIIAYMLI